MRLGCGQQAAGDRKGFRDGSFGSQFVLTRFADLSIDRELRVLKIRKVHRDDWVVQDLSVRLFETFDNLRDRQSLNVEAADIRDRDVAIGLDGCRKLIDLGRKRERDRQDVAWHYPVTRIALLQGWRAERTLGLSQ